MKKTTLLNEIANLDKELKEIRKQLYVDMITEGVDDPGIFKCVFLAGGPGSGKGYVGKEVFGIADYTKFAPSGLKVVNSDNAFETELKKNGINPKDLAKIEKEDPELWDKIQGKSPESIRNVAKRITSTQKKFYEAGRLGMVIDGTGHDFDKIKKLKDHAESLGYDCFMVFVNTSLDVAKERNQQRSRTIPEYVLENSWKACQENMGKFQQLFGSSHFRIVDNSVKGVKPTDVSKAAAAFMNQSVYNPIAKKWIATARALKTKGIIK
jgi:predicted kinase